MNRIKITSKGQITIPLNMRKKLGLTEGMHLKGEINDGKIILSPILNHDEKSELIRYARKQASDSLEISQVREICAKYDTGDLSRQVRESREEDKL